MPVDDVRGGHRHDVGRVFEPGDGVRRVEADAEVVGADRLDDGDEVGGGDDLVGLQREGHARALVGGERLPQASFGLGRVGLVVAARPHAPHEGRAELLCDVQVPGEVLRPGAAGADLERETEVGGQGPDRGQALVGRGVERQVVADLEQVDAVVGRGVAQGVVEGHRRRDAVGHAPEVGVGGEAEQGGHAGAPSCVASSASASSRIVRIASGSWAKRPRNSPPMRPAPRVSRPGPALPP